jgi:putative tricarboxylic transport membrane protein
MNKKNIGLGVFSIAFGIGMLLLSNGIRDFAAVGVGAKFFPRIAGVGFILIGALLVLQQRSALADGTSSEKATSYDRSANLSVVLSMGLLTLYLILVPRLGYIISSTIYIFGQTLILNRGAKPHYLRFALIAIISAGVTYILFVKVFRVMIPAGIFG